MSKMNEFVKKAIRSENSRIVKKSLEHMQVSFSNEFGMPMFSYALMINSYSAHFILSEMIRRGDDLNQTDIFGFTMLDHVVQRDECLLADMLIKNGGRMNQHPGDRVSSMLMMDVLVGHEFPNIRIAWEDIYERVKERTLIEFNESLKEKTQHLQFRRMIYVAKLIELRGLLARKLKGSFEPNFLQ